jgi:hypothetical protein
MPSLLDPFSPLPEDILFNKLSEKEKYLEKFIEKITAFMTNSIEKVKSHPPGSAVTAAMLAAYDSVAELKTKGTSGVVIFSANKISPGKLSYDDVDYNKLYGTDSEIKAFLPHVCLLI